MTPGEYKKLDDELRDLAKETSRIGTQIAVLASLIVLSIAILASWQSGRNYAMRAALQHGYAELCVGRADIHFKGQCPEVKP